MNSSVPMTLRQKVGQLFVCGFADPAPTEEIKILIEQYGLGGVIYFRRNVEDAEQLARLSEELQAISRQSGGQPLFIAVDQEGGMVSRIEKGVTLLPGNMALGAAGSAEGVRNIARAMGEELRQMGVNMNFAPCLDINNNPRNPVIGVRSYGETAELVSELGVQAVLGLQESGVAATVKHFPGHGDTAEDSHYDLPSLPHGMDRLTQLELVPFAAAIASGVDAVMTAHVVFPALEPSGLPSTLSPAILTGLLREQLGFDGLIVTDCLEMQAISEGVGVAEGAVQALEAGADIILVSHRFPRQQAALEAVVAAVESGRLTEARIDASLARVLACKQRRGIGASVVSGAGSDAAGVSAGAGAGAAGVSASAVSGAGSDAAGVSAGAGAGAAGAGMSAGAGSSAGAAGVSTAERRALAAELSRKSVTLVKDDVARPLDLREPTLVIWTEVRSGTEVDEVVEREGTLGEQLTAAGMTAVREVYVGAATTDEDAAAALAAADGVKQAVVVTYNAAAFPGQAKLVRELAQQPGLRLVVAAGRNPYDLLEFPEVATYYACYENRPLAMASLANVLVGREQAEGRLPVTLSAQYPRGWSFQPQPLG
ncbi:beta-N-acetylhexosaminidase [Paenibacillus athensensis]|uniref:beta-N-acetylhexosaminidase n=1 Tax=Paenibacillus athensensis TaxID=1967502 RepID=UPI00106FB958|nr:beta-N-acetylhexosaminidase [Paenibacillus athensensis]MCD1258307.1 beta-N-acetylhexosaminidase [Paenibacillus athensensis]